MKKNLQNKIKYFMILLACAIILVGVIIISLMRSKDTTDGEICNNNIVYDENEETIEEKAEGGLTESESEDGPALSENTMINFDGSDAEHSRSDGEQPNDNSIDSNESREEQIENPTERDESEDTGSWGAFY